MSAPGTSTDFRQFLQPTEDNASTSASTLFKEPLPPVQNTSTSKQTKHDATTRSQALGEQAFVGKYKSRS